MGGSVHWSEEEREAYDYAAMREQDERGKVEWAEKRTKVELARKMKAEGFESGMISRLLEAAALGISTPWNGGKAMGTHK